MGPWGREVLGTHFGLFLPLSWARRAQMNPVAGKSFRKGGGKLGESSLVTQRAVRGILMSRDKSCLPTVSRQVLTRNCPRPICLLKGRFPNYLSPTGEGLNASPDISPAVRVIARQLRGKNCLAALFVSQHQD